MKNEAKDEFYNSREENQKTSQGNNRRRRRRQNNRGNSKGSSYNSTNRTTGSDPSFARGLYADGSAGRNDISWYTKNPELIALASRLAMPYRPGNTIQLGETTEPAGGSWLGNVKVPGVMAIDYVPTIGYSDSPNSPASICAQRMWSRIRSKFSSDLTADPPDIFMYVYGLGNIHAYLACLKRMERTLNTYSADNYDFPKNVFRAMMPYMLENEFKVRFQEWLDNKNAIITQINEMVNAANVFRIPDEYPILNRMSWMNTHVYMDENRSDAQVYVMRQRCFFKIKSDGDTGTELIPVTPLANWHWNDWMAAGWELIHAMTTWEDAYTINGYIARAWEGSRAFQSALLGEFEVLAPVYVEEVLTQIENSNLCPINPADGTYPISAITQDPATNTIYHIPAGVRNRVIGNQLINLHGNTTDANVIIATRMSTMAGDKVGVTTTYQVVSGTEIITAIRIIMGGAPFTSVDRAIETNSIRVVTGGSMSAAEAYSLTKTIYLMLALQWWHHHPNVLLSLSTSTTYADNADVTTFLKNYGLIPICDLDEISCYSTEWLRQLHRVAMYSMFNCFNKTDYIGK